MSERSERSEGYSALSLAFHWFAAVFVVFQYFTHEKDTRALHISVGATFAVRPGVPCAAWPASRCSPLR